MPVAVQYTQACGFEQRGCKSFAVQSTPCPCTVDGSMCHPQHAEQSPGNGKERVHGLTAHTTKHHPSETQNPADAANEHVGVEHTPRRERHWCSSSVWMDSIACTCIITGITYQRWLWSDKQTPPTFEYHHQRPHCIRLAPHTQPSIILLLIETRQASHSTPYFNIHTHLAVTAIFELAYQLGRPHVERAR